MAEQPRKIAVFRGFLFGNYQIDCQFVSALKLARTEWLTADSVGIRVW
ncbi:hypothetical protein C404_08365 [Ralstonia sp. AU12-08]|nr:hypothetical protein C404_08365 [Ralstonia sp. AU12-08]